MPNDPIVEQARAVRLAARFDLPQSGLFTSVDEVVADVQRRLSEADQRAERAEDRLRCRDLWITGAKVDIQNLREMLAEVRDEVEQRGYDGVDDMLVDPEATKVIDRINTTLASPGVGPVPPGQFGAEGG
jgi:hypothetical protein